MTMSRKHYVEIAAILRAEHAISRSTETKVAVRNIAHSLADVFARDSDRFDRARFYAAVGEDLGVAS